MKSGIVKMSIVFIVLFIIFIFLLLRYRNTHMQVMQFEDLSDSTKVSLYYMDSITDEYEHKQVGYYTLKLRQVMKLILMKVIIF